MVAERVEELTKEAVKRAFQNAEEWFWLSSDEVWEAVFEGQCFDDRPFDEEMKTVVNKFSAVLEAITSVLKEQTGQKIDYCIDLANLFYSYGDVQIFLMSEDKVLYKEDFDYSTKWKNKEEFEAWIEKVLTTVLNRLQPVNYYQLTDSEGTYGIVKVSLPKERFLELLWEYKTTDEDYDNEGLIEFLKEKGYEVELIEPTEVWF